MNQLQAEEIERQLVAYLREDVDCRIVGGKDGRLGCLTPVEYPDGDNVAVWIAAHDTSFEVTDNGEAVMGSDPRQEPRGFFEFAEQLAREQGVSLKEGQITVESDLAGLGEAIWRAATTSAQIAQAARAANALRARRAPSEQREFVHEVERALRNRQLSVERERKIKGKSGHEYSATLYIPASETIMEPVGTHWNQATSAYAEFGDLKGANGYRLYALMDDRAEAPDEDVASLLTQVSSVVLWSRRQEWLSHLR